MKFVVILAILNVCTGMSLKTYQLKKSATDEFADYANYAHNLSLISDSIMKRYFFNDIALELADISTVKTIKTRMPKTLRRKLMNLLRMHPFEMTKDDGYYLIPIDKK